MEMPTDRKFLSGLIVAFLLLGVVARLVPHLPNVTPLTAIALFGGTYFAKRWAILLPLAIVVISDLFIGLHGVIAFTWSSFALVGLLGWWIRTQARVGRVAAASLAGSTIFFVVSNFGVWLVGDGGTMYPHTLEGLQLCYTAALPFYRNALLGDLMYTSVLFGCFAMAVRALPRIAPAH